MTLWLLLVCLILLPATIAFFADPSRSHQFSIKPAFGVGAPIVYQHEEVCTCPVPGAREVHPSERGEYYYCSIINYLRVIEVLRDGRIVAVARDHKRLCFWPDDSSLRKAHLTERFFHPLRFPS